MPSMPWIKLYTEILDDPKLGRLDAAMKWRFVELCLMAGECDAEGYLVNGKVALSIEEIAWRLRTNPAEMGAAMEVLGDIGLLAQDPDGPWFVVAFAKRQGRSQSEKRRQWRERKRRQRENTNGTEENVTPDVTRDTSGNHAGVTVPEGEGEEIRKEGEGEENVTTFDAFLKLTGGAINPITADHLSDLINELDAHRQGLPRGSPGADLCGDTWVTEAITEAGISATGRVGLRYIEAILTRWRAEGYKAPRGGKAKEFEEIETWQ